MPINTVVQGYESFRYRELWKITQWKDGCIYKTESIGYIKAEHETLLEPRLFIASSISTKLTIQDQFTIPVFTQKELIDYAVFNNGENYDY